ncbi:hypothetical protein BFJ63_vAg18245 [Fusarium oxysporum f. sp. narcissi]|uniref:Right handed beta helix domain-containing protein n=1 Tax=Fusarium oxysporum f. sp. narcissi TaxID=451672 RepID=A0A4Q2UYU0_FUSOX|nr:pectin lyase fold/virulence factor [Fusarium oxysporum]RKK75505.1 hypothetical protein BFJ71_g17102 [Fusarium oxysporum]RYC78880.1 hypothetical protein BFJ63_vAg18245 [Fusarium oxysporum f. sp. narcissi]
MKLTLTLAGLLGLASASPFSGHDTSSGLKARGGKCDWKDKHCCAYPDKYKDNKDASGYKESNYYSYGHTAYVKHGRSIQHAINKASPGDRIVVEAGTYHEQLLINKDGIELVGHGAILVPPVKYVKNVCTGVTKNEKGVDTDAGICIAGYNVKKAPFQAEHARVASVGKPVRDVSVTGFDVRGFSGVNVVVIGAKNTNIYKNKLTDAPAYGALTLGSYNTVFSENIITTTQGGFIGICMDNYSDVLIKKNEISKVFIGLCVQTNGAVLAYNNLYDNCNGIYVDPGVRGVQLIHNHISKSGPAAACGGSTTGITLDGASDTVVRDNVIEGQHADGKGTGILIFDDECKATPQGELSLSCIALGHKAVAKDNVVIRNTLRDNDVDIVNNSKGSGNVIKCNTCETPANLKAGQCHKGS